MNRQWRQLKHHKRSGYISGVPGPGSMAGFCPGCPQPGVNLPADWKDDPSQEVYTRTVVMDGNFSAIHQRRHDAAPDVNLTNGELYLVAEQPYAEHIKSAVEDRDPPTCHRHHAVMDKFIKHKGQDITGIGATACGRHGNFCPSGVVNFQKGERQMNMDYSLCHAILNSNMGDLPNLIVLYDISCQFHINFARRVARSPFMDYPFDKNTFWGIGEFHVGGHIERCFPRHSPQFIPGAGMVDGEILETLWSVLNEVSPSTHTATLASRTETLDDHMMDSNWKKLTGMGACMVFLSLPEC